MKLTTQTRRTLLRTALATTALVAPCAGAAYAAGNDAPSGNIVLAWHSNIAARWLDPKRSFRAATPNNFRNAAHDPLIKNSRDDPYDHFALTDRVGLGAMRGGGACAGQAWTFATTDGKDLPRTPELASPQAGLLAPETRRLRIVIVSEVRFLREGLAEFLERDPSISVVGLCADLAEVLALSSPPKVDVVLVDAALRNGIAAARWTRDVKPDVRIIAFAVRETKEDVIAWAEAGAIGYVPDTAPLADLVGLIMDIHGGVQPCSGRVAAELLRRIALTESLGTARNPLSPAPALTRREREAAELIATGLSDKEIARRLNISLATAKLHVHNLLGKLNVQRRGQVADIPPEPDAQHPGLGRQAPGHTTPLSSRSSAGVTQRYHRQSGSPNIPKPATASSDAGYPTLFSSRLMPA